MINNVSLVGRLTKDVELAYTQSGKAYSNITVAVNRNFKNANGEREADFINCVLWGGQAEFLANYGSKGSLIGITGRIETSNYTNEQMQKVFVTKVVADSVQLLESRKQDNVNQAPQSTQTQQTANNPFNDINTNVPGFNNNNQQNFNNNQPFADNSAQISNASELFGNEPF